MIRPKQIHADDQQHVEFRKPLANLRRPERQALSIERMVGGKAEPAMRRARLRKHRGAKPLGDRDQFRAPRRARPRGCRPEFPAALPTAARRPLARLPPGRAAFRDRADRTMSTSISADSVCKSSGIDRNTGPVGGVSAVCIARRMAEGISSTRCNFDGPFRPRPNDAQHVAPQDRLLELQPAVLLAGGEQQRRAGAKRVVEHPHRVAQAGADVDIHDAQLARGHRVAVGHRHHGHFLQAEDVLQARVGQSWRRTAATRSCRDCRTDSERRRRRAFRGRRRCRAWEEGARGEGEGEGT